MMSQIGKERGWPPITRAQYDATRSRTEPSSSAIRRP